MQLARFVTSLIHGHLNLLALMLSILFGVFLWIAYMRMSVAWNQIIVVTPEHLMIMGPNRKTRASVRFSNVNELKLVQRREDAEPSFYAVGNEKHVGLSFGPEVENVRDLIALIELRTGKKFSK